MNDRGYRNGMSGLNIRSLACLALLTPSGLPAADWQSTGFISRSFTTIALQNEYAAQPANLRKWTQPIRYRFEHRTGDRSLHEQISEIHLRHLTDITGLVIEPAGKQPANLDIIFSTEQSLHDELANDLTIQSDRMREQLSRNSICIAHIRVNNDSEIQHARVIIPVDRARAHAKLLSCVVEELTQILGMPNDSPQVFPSIFNDHSHDDVLSGLDEIMLRLLYDPTLRPGMSQSQVQTTIDGLLETSRFQQLIQSADERVNSQGIAPLLDGRTQKRP